jgi:hypothetical protein
MGKKSVHDGSQLWMKLLQVPGQSAMGENWLMIFQLYIPKLLLFHSYMPLAQSWVHLKDVVAKDLP